MAFSLVQRLEAAPDGRCRNPLNDEAPLWVSKFLLDAGAKVDLAYMGRIEFEERPTLIGSANRIAVASKKLNVIKREIEVPRYTGDVHFVCTDEQAEDLLPEWETWAQAPESIEPTGFFDDEDSHHFEDVVGWWALNEDLIWTQDAGVAENIRGAFVTILDNVSGNQ